MDPTLTICVSPGTYRLLKNDTECRKQVTQNVLAKDGTSFSQIIITESGSQENLPKERCGENTEPIFTPNIRKNDDDEKINDKSKNWHDAPTKLMLSLMEELRPKLGKSIHVKTKGKLYKIIAEKMIAEGYEFTPLQIENKFRGLERTYKKTVLNNKQTGRNRQTCAYESELNQILKNKKGINPEFLLDSGDVEEVTQNQGEDDRADDASPSKDESSPSNIFKKKSKFGVREQILSKMEEISNEKKDFHAKVLDLMQKKDERARKREERSEKKLELLEKLVNQRQK